MTVRQRLQAGIGVVVAGIALAGCGAPVPSTATSMPTESPTAIATPSTVAPTPSAVTEPLIAVDPSLLALLPANVSGVAVAPDPDTAAALATDRTLAPHVVALATAAAFGPVATDSVGDYVVVTVAKLGPDVFDDRFFRDWRDTFDEAVCTLAGGIEGHAEADIAGHHTYIGTCGGGVRTYHVHMPTSDVIVSMQALGDGRFGERLVAGLTE